MGAGINEDPVTGSLNAGLAQWLIGSGRAPDSYVASQGTALARAGRVHVVRIGDDIWIGGNTTTNIKGVLSFQP
jgi:predicted PhzF superfamily epimerase YddE/YHI9